ncbi:MAG: hypothetical protein LBU32_32670 [Clostridiales bacterium]|nr:hypothetical protein [Clostridiales bacterium]
MKDRCGLGGRSREPKARASAARRNLKEAGGKPSVQGARTGLEAGLRRAGLQSEAKSEGGAERRLRRAARSACERLWRTYEGKDAAPARGGLAECRGAGSHPLKRRPMRRCMAERRRPAGFAAMDPFFKRAR